MSSRVRLLRLSTVELHRLLDLPASTIIEASCTDPMVQGEILLRIEDEQFSEVQPGNQIPKCAAWYQTIQQTMDESGQVVHKIVKFKAYD